MRLAEWKGVCEDDMPNDFMALDHNLPRFTGEEDIERRVDMLADYQYQMLEALRYMMLHLDTRNFNMTEVDRYLGTITDPINARIGDAEGNLTELSVTAKGLAARISDAEGNVASLQVTATQLASQISDANGNISQLQQTASSIMSTVSNQAGQISSLWQTATGIQTTVSNQAGQISVLQQTATSLSSSIADANGNISRISQRVDGIGFSVNGSSLVLTKDGVSVSHELQASSLRGDIIYVNDGYGGTAATITATGASSYTGQKFYLSSGAVELRAHSGDVYLSASNGSLQIGSGQVSIGGDCVPYSDSWFSLGRGGLKWSDVYASNGTIVTSDRKQKKDIAYGLGRYSAFFDALRPVSYKLREGQSGRTHLGLIAQDVEDALVECGLTDMDFAGFIRSPREDGGFDYALRYGEIIAMLVYEVQRLKRG